jgi:hypothetical protein
VEEKPPCTNDDPFMEAFIWPDSQGKSNSKKTKRAPVKIPSVATSEKWQQYHQNKEAKKTAEEAVKKEKQAERKRKKDERESIQNAKKTRKTIKKTD